MICKLIYFKRQINAHSLPVSLSSASTIGKPDTVIGHACGKGILCGFRLRLSHKIAEGG